MSEFFETPKQIGDSDKESAPPVLGASEDGATLNEPDKNHAGIINGLSPSIDAEKAEETVLARSDIEIKPPGTIDSRDLKPGDIGYTDKKGGTPVLTNENKG